MWFAALSIAARNGMSPVDLSNHHPVSFVEGDTFDREPWMIRVLMLVAIAIDKSIQVLDDPARMMAIANGLAAAGAPIIIEMLTKGTDDPIWNLSEAIGELLYNDSFETTGDSEDARG